MTTTPRTSTTQKNWTLLFAVLVMFTLTACGGGGSSSTTTTAPVATGIADNASYKDSVTITFDAGVTATLTSEPLAKITTTTTTTITSGTVVSEEGKYTLVLTKDANTTTYHFVIDKTAPVITGAVDKGSYNKAVTLVCEAGSVCVVDGTTIPSNTALVSAEGTHTASATDTAGNVTVIVFNLDFTAPTITGAVNGGNYNAAVTLTCETGSTCVVDGATIASNTTTVSTEGAHTASATDTAGNVTSISFTLDFTAPTASGITNNGIYKTDVTPTFTGTATLNGVAFTSGTTVSAENAYTLIVTDAADNSSTYHFTIDKTAPTISVTNKQTVSLTTAGSQWVCDIVFSEAISQTPVMGTNFSLDGVDPIAGGVGVSTVTLVSVGNNTYRLSADFKSQNWAGTTPTTWRVKYRSGGVISDLAGNSITLADLTILDTGTVNP